jgi:hypothetical protein
MAIIAVELDGLDHIISGEGTEHTLCGLPVPHGLPWVTDVTAPCPECYPDAKPKAKAKKKTTLYRMLDRDDGTLVTAIEKAEGEAEATYTKIVADAAVKNWTAAAWWLERRRPDDFARRERVEMTGKDGGPIDTRNLSTLPDHERRALADAIRSHLRGEGEPEPSAAGDRQG